MRKKEKLIAGLIVGAAAGIAAALFFETERGKKLLGSIKQLASDSFDDAMARLSKVEEKLKQKMTIDDIEEEI